jgi:hypothetical protein
MWRRIVGGVLMAAVLAGCSSLLPPTPTPVDFALPTPTVEVTATAPPTPTPQPTDPAETLPTRLLNPEASEEVAFEGEAGETVAVSVTVEDGSPLTQMALVDRFGNVVIEVGAAASGEAVKVDAITLPYTGIYRAVLRTEGAAGTVRVAVEPVQRAGNIQPFDPTTGAEGQFEGGVRGQVYETQLEAGQHLRLVSSLDGVIIKLHGPDGEQVLQAETRSDPFTVRQSGSYRLIVTHSGPGGAFALRAIDETQVPTAAGETDIPRGQVQRYRFVGDEPARLTFDGSRGEVIAVPVFDLTEDIRLDVLVRSPFGQVLAFVTGSEAGVGAGISQLQLPYDGRYTLELRPEGDGEASYRVDVLPTEALTGGGTFGEVLAGSFGTPGTFHTAQFDGRYGDVVTLRVRDFSGREGFSPVLALIAPDGGQIAAAVTEEGSMPAIEGYTLMQNGQYTVMLYTVTDVGGRYEITFERQ